MSTTNSPNMNLPIPSVGNESGPQYAFDVNNCLALLDQHNHTPGYGVQIPPAGLNINSALTFQNNFATNVAGITLIAQSSTPSNGTIYEAGVDLYFTDGIGNNVRITQSGAVAGTPGSISNLVSPASASYVALSSTFVFQSNTSIAANLDAASLVMRNISPNSTFGLTLQPPASLSSNYSLTLPSLPIVTNLMTMTSSGVMAANANVDNTTLQFSGSVLSVKNAGVGTTQIADGSVTPAKLSALAYTVSASSGTFSTTSTTFVDVTGLSSLVTAAGRPMIVQLMPDSTGSTAVLRAAQSSSGIVMQILRDATVIAVTAYDAPGSTQVDWAPALTVFDVPSAGSHTYKMQVKTTSGSTISILHCALVAYSL